MRKDNGTGISFTTIVIAGLAVAVGGCAPDDEEPIPQAKSEKDLMPDEDDVGGRSASHSSEEDLGPHEAARSVAESYRYDRAKARAYIERYALHPNRKLAYCALNDGTQADCTNFASQVLWYAGLPMRYTASSETGWWYRYSCVPSGSSHSWRQVNRLLQYLVTETDIGEFKKSARELKVGDLIFYRVRHAEDGYACDGNLFNHTTVVSSFDPRGEPLVSYHSNEALNVPWDKKTGSPGALGEACAFAFVHIRD